MLCGTRGGDEGGEDIQKTHSVLRRRLLITPKPTVSSISRRWRILVCMLAALCTSGVGRAHCRVAQQEPQCWQDCAFLNFIPAYRLSNSCGCSQAVRRDVYQVEVR